MFKIQVVVKPVLKQINCIHYLIIIRLGQNVIKNVIKIFFKFWLITLIML
jgi:hypothetical protein